MSAPAASSIVAVTSSRRWPWSTAGSRLASREVSASASTLQVEGERGGELLGAGGCRQLGAQPGDVVVDRDRGQRCRVDLVCGRRGRRAQPLRRCDWARRRWPRRRSRTAAVARTATTRRRQREVAGRSSATGARVVNQCSTNGRAAVTTSSPLSKPTLVPNSVSHGASSTVESRRRRIRRRSGPAPGGCRARIGDHEEQEDQRFR